MQNKKATLTIKIEKLDADPILMTLSDESWEGAEFEKLLGDLAKPIVDAIKNGATVTLSK